MMRYLLCFILAVCLVGCEEPAPNGAYPMYSDLPDSSSLRLSTDMPDSNRYVRYGGRDALRWKWPGVPEKTYGFTDMAVVCTEVVYLDSVQTDALGYDRACMTVMCDTMFVLHHRRSSY